MKLKLAENEKYFFSKKFLIQLILPILGEQLLAVTIGVADSIMVASVGEAAISGVSLVDSLAILFINLFSAFATGGAVVTSQYLGRKDNKNAKIAARQLFYLCFFIGLIISIILVPFKQQILSKVYGHLDAPVMQSSLIYFDFVFWYFPFLGIFNACSALFRSIGDSKVSLKVSLLMNIVNIALNALFIYVLKYGVFGAGLATFISRVFSGIFILVLIIKKDSPVKIDKIYKVRFDFPMIKRIFNISWPNAVENSVFQVGKIAVQGIVASLGMASIAANSVVNNVCTFANLPGVAVYLASTTIIGQCIGANEKKQARYYVKLLFLISYSLIFIVTIVLMFFIKDLIGLYNLGAEASQLAYDVSIVVLIFTILLWTPAFASPNFLRSAGDVKYTMVCSLFSMFTFRVIGAYVLTDHLMLGLLGVWIAMIIDWCCRSTCFLTRLKGDKWMDKKVI